jgi:hypothetical protein
VLGKRHIPGGFSFDEEAILQHNDAIYVPSKKTDFLWFLVRCINNADMFKSSNHNQVVPGWTTFNSLLCKKHVPIQNQVAYLPMIEANASEYSTVNMMLEQSVSMAVDMRLENIIIAFDQAIYAKAVDIVWKEKEKFGPVVL